jgi:hypothetical protein
MTRPEVFKGVVTKGHQILQEYRLDSKQNAGQVYVIKAFPKISPIDINISFLISEGWKEKIDRLRFSQEQIFIRKFNLENDYCVIVQFQRQSKSLVIYSNDLHKAEEFLKQVFLETSLLVTPEEINVLSRGWNSAPHDLLYFCGCVDAAYHIFEQ